MTECRSWRLSISSCVEAGVFSLFDAGKAVSTDLAAGSVAGALNHQR